MVKKKKKYDLTDAESSILTTLHRAQLAGEISLFLIIIGILTINVASLWQTYGLIDFFLMSISSLGLLISGSLITVLSFFLKKHSNRISKDSNALRTWVILTWCWIPVTIVLLILESFLATPPIANLIFLAAAAVCFFTSVIMVLINCNILWKRYKYTSNKFVRPIVYGVTSLIIALTAIFGNYTQVATVNFDTEYVTTQDLELGDEEIRQQGKNGTINETRNLLFGFTTSTNKTDPVNQITAKGARRYQYMFCSDGSYRYYNAEQYKNPSVGFTHKSPDNCAENGQGAQTTLSDTPPAEKQTMYVPTYRNTPSTTNCYSFSSYSISCHTY